MIEKAKITDCQEAAEMAVEMWMDNDPGELEEEFKALVQNPEAAIFLYREEGQAVGFAQCQLRHDYVEGTKTSPVGYLEGIYVLPGFRGRGIAKALLNACEEWAREKGCREFASDCELDNTGSLAFHLAVGFREANRIICFARKL